MISIPQLLCLMFGHRRLWRQNILQRTMSPRLIPFDEWMNRPEDEAAQGATQVAAPKERKVPEGRKDEPEGAGRDSLSEPENKRRKVADPPFDSTEKTLQLFQALAQKLVEGSIEERDLYEHRDLLLGEQSRKIGERALDRLHGKKASKKNGETGRTKKKQTASKRGANGKADAKKPSPRRSKEGPNGKADAKRVSKFRIIGKAMNSCEAHINRRLEHLPF